MRPQSWTALKQTFNLHSHTEKCATRHLHTVKDRHRHKHKYEQHEKVQKLCINISEVHATINNFFVYTRTFLHSLKTNVNLQIKT